MTTTIPTSPKREAFEDWLREEFKVRALDILRKPGDLEVYADPGIQFAYAAFLAGIEWAPFITFSESGRGL